MFISARSSLIKYCASATFPAIVRTFLSFIMCTLSALGLATMYPIDALLSAAIITPSLNLTATVVVPCFVCSGNGLLFIPGFCVPWLK